MRETREILLGGQTFAVPPLPLRINRVVYPLCLKFVTTGLIDRAIAAGGSLDCDDEEMDDLSRMLFLSAKAANPDLDQSEFDELPITPPEMIDAFFTIRYQTGAWVPVAAKSAEEEGTAQEATKTEE